MSAQIIVLQRLSSDSQHASELASVICKLVSDGAELGALEDREISDLSGNTTPIKVIPRIWLQRLERAIDVGVFGRLSVDEIVARILTTPPPESVKK